MSDKTVVIFNKLLNATDSDSIHHLLESDDFFSSANCHWLPYGGKLNNAGTIEGQMAESSGALVEKLTNSIDAILMSEHAEKGGNPMTINDAVSLYFGAHIFEDSNSSSWAKRNIVVTASGSKDTPTINIVDKGEGQDSVGLQKRILSLDGTLKAKTPFVFGKYNQGGSASIRFCGTRSEHRYQLIVTRKRKIGRSLIADSNHKWSFTLVRQRVQDRVNIYEYCVGRDQSVFSFSAERIDIGIPDFEFTHGCLFRLYDYNLRHKTNITVGTRSLSTEVAEKLVYPPLPIYFHEMRDFKNKGRGIIARGLLRKLRGKEYVKYHRIEKINLGSGMGECIVESFAMQHSSSADKKVNSEYSAIDDRVRYVDSGLSLSKKKASHLSGLGLPYLARNLFVFIDMTNTSTAAHAIFSSDRSRFLKSWDADQVEAAIDQYLKSQYFKNLETEYSEMSRSTSVVGDDVRFDIEKFAKLNPDFVSVLAKGEAISTLGSSLNQEKKFEGQYNPVEFTLAGDEVRAIPVNRFALLSFRTGAVKDFLERSKDRFSFLMEGVDAFTVITSGVKDGYIKCMIRPNSTMSAGVSYPVKARLLDENGIDYYPPVDFRIDVLDENKKDGLWYPTFMEFASKATLRIKPGRTKKIVISTDAEDSYFSRPEDPGTIKFSKSEDYSIGRLSLKSGRMHIEVSDLTKTVGREYDVAILVSDSSGNEFNLVASFKVVPVGDSDDFSLPERVLVKKAEWQLDGRNWTASNVSRVMQSNGKYIVEINADNSFLRSASSKAGPFASSKWLDDVYIASVLARRAADGLKEPESFDFYSTKELVFDRCLQGFGSALSLQLQRTLPPVADDDD